MACYGGSLSSASASRTSCARVDRYDGEITRYILSMKATSVARRCWCGPLCCRGSWYREWLMRLFIDSSSEIVACARFVEPVLPQSALQSSLGDRLMADVHRPLVFL